MSLRDRSNGRWIPTWQPGADAHNFIIVLLSLTDSCELLHRGPRQNVKELRSLVSHAISVMLSRRSFLFLAFVVFGID
jgi:hypothetical protein